MSLHHLQESDPRLDASGHDNKGIGELALATLLLDLAWELDLAARELPVPPVAQVRVLPEGHPLKFDPVVLLQHACANLLGLLLGEPPPL